MSWGPGVDWKSHKRLHITAGVHSAALTGYQYPVKCIIGEGTNGSYTSDSGNEGSVFYILPGQCRSDFVDFRFYCGDIAYDFHRFAKTDNVSAEWNVEVASDLTSDGVLDIYYGNFGDGGAVDASSAANTYVTAPISGVVAAYPLDEADQEVSPTVIADDDQAAFWTATGATITLTNDTVNKTDGTNCLSFASAAASDEDGAYQVYGGAQDWSAKSVLRLKFTGANSGNTYTVGFGTDATADIAITNGYTYDITDDSTALKEIVVPVSSCTVVGVPNLAGTRKVIFKVKTVVGDAEVFLDRLVVDTGVSAVDYSGNGNDGAATGTTIEDSPFHIGKKARRFNGLGDKITVPYAASLDLTNFTLIALIKPTVTGQHGLLNLGGFDSAPHVYLRNAAGYSIAVKTNDAGTRKSVTVGTLAAYNNTPQVIAGRYNGSDCSAFVNGTKFDDVESEAAIARSLSDMIIGYDAVSAPYYFDGVLAGFYLFGTGLSDAQIQSITVSNFADSSLIAGSVCVRKWADTTNPSHGSWEPEHKYYPKGIYSLSRPRQQLKLKKLKPDQIAAIREYFINRVEVEVV